MRASPRTACAACSRRRAVRARRCSAAVRCRWRSGSSSWCGSGLAMVVFGAAREGDAIVATRAFYGWKVHAELEFPAGRPVLLLLRPTVWPPAAGGGSARVSELALEPVASRARHMEFREA